MPTLKIINGIKIDCYSGDHAPPHVHVWYAEYEVLIEIETLNIYAGDIPNKAFKRASAYIEKNREELLAIFNALNPKLKR